MQLNIYNNNVSKNNDTITLVCNIWVACFEWNIATAQQLATKEIYRHGQECFNPRYNELRLTAFEIQTINRFHLECVILQRPSSSTDLNPIDFGLFLKFNNLFTVVAVNI